MVKHGIDHTLVFMFCSIAMLYLWFFLRFSLENNPWTMVVGTLCVVAAVVRLGVCVWSPKRLEFLMLVFPIGQFYAYRRMVTTFKKNMIARPCYRLVETLEVHRHLISDLTCAFCSSHYSSHSFATASS